MNEKSEVWLCSNKKCDFAWFVDHDNTIDYDTCDDCGSKLLKTPIILEEYFYIKSISDDRDFLDAMIELKQKDIIEFKTKIAQFKVQVDAQEERERQEKNKPKCPTCGSTNISKISATSKAIGAIGFGLLSKTARSQFKCNKCGYKW